MGFPRSCCALVSWVRLDGKYTARPSRRKRYGKLLFEAGRELASRPFGVEAQRLLRLEKRHVIVGVDTDALTNPYEADMGWAVKLEKPDFVGKALFFGRRQRLLARTLDRLCT